MAFWRHSEPYYRTPDGKPTSQLAEYRQTIRAIRELYGLEPATSFGPLALKAVRQKMVSDGLSRSEVNRRVALARRVFKWAVSEELIPFDVYDRLTAVTGLQKGRSEAPDCEPVTPVDDVHVEATLPFLNRQVRGLIQFMRWTECRPWTYTYANAGELIEKSQGSGAPTWWYRYDHDSHMTQATYANDGSTVTVVVDYVYDVFGNLIGRTEADGGTVVSVEAFVVDSWDTAKPGAMGNENYDDYADLAPSGSGWAAVAQRLFGPGFNEPVAGITASSAVGWYAADGHLYLCGMFAWAGNQTAPGGFYRVRHTGKPANLPIGLKAQTGGVELTFTDEIDAKAAVDPANYEVKVWGLKRTQNYGSKHIDEKKLAVLKATVDGKTVRLEIVGLAPTWGMEIKYRLKGTDGRAAAGVIHNTVHTLSKPSANFGQEVVDREREGGGKLDVDRVEDAEQVMASSGPIARDAIGNEKCLHKRERVHPRHSTTPGRSKQRGIRFAETRRNRCELSSCQLVRARR